MAVEVPSAASTVSVSALAMEGLPNPSKLKVVVAACRPMPAGADSGVLSPGAGATGVAQAASRHRRNEPGVVTSWAYTVRRWATAMRWPAASTCASSLVKARAFRSSLLNRRDALMAPRMPMSEITTINSTMVKPRTAGARDAHDRTVSEGPQARQGRFSRPRMANPLLVWSETER